VRRPSLKLLSRMPPTRGRLRAAHVPVLQSYRVSGIGNPPGGGLLPFGEGERRLVNRSREGLSLVGRLFVAGRQAAHWPPHAEAPVCEGTPFSTTSQRLNPALTRLARLGRKNERAMPLRAFLEVEQPAESTGLFIEGLVANPTELPVVLDESEDR